MSPPGREATQRDSREVEPGQNRRGHGAQERRKAARRAAREVTVQAINVNADVRREARDGTDVAGWRARCSCGWNELVKVGVEDAHGPAVTKAWTAHAKRFDNDRHTLVRALPELGERDHLPHANAVQRLTGDLEGLFMERRVETAGSLTTPYRGRTAHYREDR